MKNFTNLVGFSDSKLGYRVAKENLEFVDGKIISKKNGKKFGAGHLEVVSLADLRNRVTSISPSEKNSFVHMHQAGDVKKHLTDPTNQNSLFQVASQFNLLEMASPAMTPERGVDIYYNDPTQGPACSVCAIGATLYRNYFIPVGNREGRAPRTHFSSVHPSGLG